MFLAAEYGHEHLNLQRVCIDCWEFTGKQKPWFDARGVLHTSFMHILEELEAQQRNLPYDTLVTDTADMLYNLCYTFMCKKLGMEHPSDVGHGKGWAAIKVPFQAACLRLRNLQCGLIYITHTKTRLVLVGEREEEKKEASLAGQAQAVINPEVDLILRADYRDNERVIITQGSENTEGGSRWRLPESFPMTETGGYQILLGHLKRGMQTQAQAPVITKKKKIVFNP